MSIGSAEAAAFLHRKKQTLEHARQRAALQLVCGLDLDALEALSPAARHDALGRVERALRRMRQAGLRCHWSYDLNRHIALRQAFERLGGQAAAPRGGHKRKRRNRRAAVAPFTRSEIEA